MTLTDAQKADVRAVMEEYAGAYRTKDIRGMMEIFSSDICGFGSGPDEVIGDHRGFVRQIRRDMDQATILAVRFSDTQINGDGRVAWVRTRSSITFRAGGSPVQTLHGRSTMVMRHTGRRWLIGQIHFSLPFTGQSEGQSFPGA
jgi:ketosteroid isomerase-like protein